jgi:putative RecB family exonuclease
MDIHDLRKTPHLSASGVNAYLECGLQYRFSRIDGLPPEFRAGSLEFGSAVHAALADFNQERMQGRTPPAAELEAMFEKHCRNPETLKSGKALLRACHENLVSEDYRILAIEEPFTFYIEGLPVPVIGIMDLVLEDGDGTVVIVDYKTSSRAYTADEADMNFQLSVYHMAAKANGHADKEVLLRLDCLVKTKTPRLEQYYTARTSDDGKRAAKKILSVWNAISSGIFIPNDTGWRCKTCAWKKHCEAWFEGV